MGKLAEHAVLSRLTRYLEENEVYPHTMIGFRAGLSTQDAMKLIKHQVIDGDGRGVKAILGLDLEKAFDNVRHSYNLKSISGLGLGGRFHDYVGSFLSGRTTTLRVVEVESKTLNLGG
ncbi:uncharacterized protein [Dermacentor albipictus]|uniref:uncharacterized protein n=1 Tax=Dermacentor albipictus TaxID=60249 RepID=UPI0038FC9BA0